MKINQIINEMTSGSVATVAKPLGEIQKRPEVKGLKPVDKAMTGKSKKKGPYANSLLEGKVKELQMDLSSGSDGLSDIEFKKKYGKSKQEMRKALQDKPKSDKPVQEAKLDEDDLILIPGQGVKRKTGFVPHGQSRVDHEVEMARSDVLATMKNAKAIYELLRDRSEDEGLEGWVQEKLIKANDYLNSVKEYYDEKNIHQEMSGGVIAGGGVGEGKFTVNAKTGAKLHPRTGVELPPKEKPLTMKDMFRQPKSTAPKLTLDDVWRKVENVVGQIYPDGDPIDHLAPWLEKHGIRDFKIGEILDRAAKKNGYKDLYDYYNSMGSLSEQGVAEGDWGWDDPQYDKREPERDEDWEYERYRQQELDDEDSEKNKDQDIREGVVEESDVPSRVGFNDIVVTKQADGNYRIVRKGGAWMRLKQGEILTMRDIKELKANRAVFHVEKGVAEGWKDKLGAAVLAGSLAAGAGSAHGRVSYDDEGNQIGGLKPNATVTAPSYTKPAPEAPKGLSKEYLQRAANPDRVGRFLISVEKAQELLNQIKEGAKVDRMVKHIAKSERGLGHSKKEAENIAWATANKRGMLDNKNKKSPK